jgi:hypothetical protein
MPQATFFFRLPSGPSLFIDHSGVRSEFDIALELDISECSTELNDGPERINSTKDLKGLIQRGT